MNRAIQNVELAVKSKTQPVASTAQPHEEGDKEEENICDYDYRDPEKQSLKPQRTYIGSKGYCKKIKEQIHMASPRRLDVLFRFVYLIVYFIVLLVLFCLPVSNKYEE